jgi:hypothetical protein
LLDFEIPINELEKRTGLTFNLKFPKSLIDYDYQVLSMRKEDYNRSSLEPKVLRGESYSEISSYLRKMKMHKINPPNPLVLAKIEELTISNPELFKKNSTACDRVSKLLWIKKDLRYNGYLS